LWIINLSLDYTLCDVAAYTKLGTRVLKIRRNLLPKRMFVPVYRAISHDVEAHSTDKPTDRHEEFKRSQLISKRI
jgi:hypothetical protein